MKLLSLSVERFGALAGLELDFSMASAAVTAPVATPAPESDPNATAPKPKAKRATKKAAKSATSASSTSATVTESGAYGLTVVYGANEAGKTTLLRAVRFLLLGEEKAAKRGAAPIGGDAPVVRGVIELASGSRVALERRRGKQSWSGHMIEGGDPIDEDWFVGAIGHPDATLFRNVFAFSLDELARGAEVLEKGHLDGLLFGSGLGGMIQPSEILSGLEEDKARLFKEKGSQQSIALRLGRIGELKSDLGNVSKSADELAQLDAQIEEAARAASAAKTAHAELDREKERLRAIAAAIEPLIELRAAEEERAALASTVALPASARVDMEKAIAVATRLRAEIANEEAALPELDAKLAAIQVDESILWALADIDALEKGVGRYLEARDSLPGIERERAALDSRTERKLGELWQAGTLDKLVKLSLPREALTRMQSAAHEVERVEREAKAEELALRDRLQALSVEATRAARMEVTLRAKLDPAPPPGDPALAPLPRVEDVVEFERWLAECDADARRLREELKRVETELASTKRQIAEIVADGHVPTEGELAKARARRDAGWAIVARALRGETNQAAAKGFDPNAPLPVAFERSMHDADVVADRMRVRADAVQRRAQKEAAALHLNAELERLNAAYDTADAGRESAIAQWNTLWEPAGVMPKSPARMRAWLADHATWVAAAERAREVDIERSKCAKRLEALSDHGATAARDQARASAMAGFKIALADLGFEGVLGPTTATRTLDDLGALRESYEESKHSLDEREAKLTDAVKRFEERALSVLSSVDRTRGASGIEVDVERLAESAAHARGEQKRAADLEERIMRVRSECARKRAALAEADTTLDDLAARAGVPAGNRDELAQAITLSERRGALDKVISEAERALTRVRGPFTLEELRAAASGTSADAVALEIAGLEARREALRTTWDERVRAESRLLAERDRIDGSARAAEIAADLAAERASLRADVERYAVLALAKASLDRSIADFERLHQPELIEEASRIFSEMTGGRYARILVRRAPGAAGAAGGSADKREIFVERANGERKSPDQLSTGTNEQLFFALRLAYVALYAKASEPLPIVLDDILVNFDAARTEATLRALSHFATRSQVLFFTCHEHLLQRTKAVAPGARLIAL